MDDLLREFLTETNESLDTVDNQLVKFEQEPNNSKILDNIFRLVHTIKGTCGFLGLPRLEALAHAAETLKKTPSTSIPAWPSSPAACTASTVSSWSSSTSIASSNLCPKLHSPYKPGRNLK
jgi:HPt (histidine-containing phosphotransfer) domain-containing protein